MAILGIDFEKMAVAIPLALGNGWFTYGILYVIL